MKAAGPKSGGVVLFILVVFCTFRVVSFNCSVADGDDDGVIVKELLFIDMSIGDSSVSISIDMLLFNVTDVSCRLCCADVVSRAPHDVAIMMIVAVKIMLPFIFRAMMTSLHCWLSLDSLLLFYYSILKSIDI